MKEKKTLESMISLYKKRGHKNPEKSARAYLKGLMTTDKGQLQVPPKERRKIKSKVFN